MSLAAGVRSRVNGERKHKKAHNRMTKMLYENISRTKRPFNVE